MKDMLEENPPQEYFLTQKDVERIGAWKSFENPLDEEIIITGVLPHAAIKKDSTVQTITAHAGHGDVPILIKEEGKEMTIRKLTPRECWRLMGFDDEDFDKASKVCSKNQLYKQAGNSIVVNVLEAIFMNLFFDQKDEGYRQSNIFDFL